MRIRFLGDREWFFEELQNLEEPEVYALGLLPERDVHRSKTPYQTIEIFDCSEFGRVLVLDGLIQLTTKNEAVYHEMLVHPALASHRNPRRVMIVGGGDGGALRETVKHPVDEILLVDIDAEVIRACREYLPEVSQGAFDDSRVRVVNADAFQVIGEHAGRFDAVIVDSTDCYGPSEALWKMPFYRLCKKALRRGGVASFQTGFFKEHYAQRGRAAIRKAFAYTQTHRAYVRCYPFDESVFLVGSDHVNLSRTRPNTLARRCRERSLQTRYYSPEIHVASAVIPECYHEP